MEILALYTSPDTLGSALAAGADPSVSGEV